MIRIPLSQIASPEQFADAVSAYREALEAHCLGPPGVAAPHANELVASVVGRVPQPGPVETRGPDAFVVLPYEIHDDRPVSPDHEKTISTLRQTILG